MKTINHKHRHVYIISKTRSGITEDAGIQRGRRMKRSDWRWPSCQTRHQAMPLIYRDRWISHFCHTIHS